MSTQVAIRRGNTAQTAAFTGVVAELTVDTDKKVVVVHDGTTAGGNPLVKANASITTGQILTSNGSQLIAIANTGTAGVYGNASFIPVVTTDAYGRVSSVTNTAIAISSGVVTGVMTFAQGGANATSYTTGGLLTSNGTSFVSVANTGTAGTYGNAAYHPVITTDAYGRVNAVTNTLVQIAASQVTSGVLPFAQGGSNNTTYTTGAILTSNGTAFVALANTGTAGTYANAAYVPVLTTDAYGRVSSVTNTAIAITSTAVTGVMTFAQGGANATTYTTGQFLTSNGTALVSVANTGTAGTYANAAYIPVITTDAYGRVSSVTNTAVAIDTSQITSGTIVDARLAATGTAGTYANAAYVPVITTDSKGRVTTITNTAIAIDTSQITSGTVADARLPTKGTAGTYANAAYIPVITTDAYGRVTGITNTSVAIDTSQLTSGTVADARLPTKGTAGTYANSTYIPVITTDAYGRVTAITNTVIQSSTTSVQGIVQLTDSISSTSTTTAATPNSVKTAYDLAATKFNSSGGTISGDTTITGNLVVNGTTTTVNTSTVSTSDSLLKLANNNTAGDSLDIGFYGTYNATGQKYAGLVRQAGSNFFLFKDLTTDPTANTLATGSLTAANTATLRANITGGTVSSLASAIGVADGGTGATTLTAGGILIGSGTSAVTILANTGTAGTYANAAYIPVITTDTYGRVSAVTNTAIAIDTAAITSGTLADARLPTKGTAGTYANAAYHPVITTDAYGRVTAVTNTIIQIAASQVTSGVLPFGQGGSNASTYTTGSLLTSNGTAFVSVSNTGTSGTYANAAYVPVITTDAYGRVSSVTNTAIAIDTGALTSGTIADVRLPTKGTAGTYANAAYLPVITTDAYGRVTAVTNTLVQIATTQITSGVLPFAQGGANATSYTTGAILTSNGTAFVALSNTGTAGTYANAAYVPVITTDAYGRVSSVTNTAISIDTSQLGSGTVADARLPTKGTAGTYANAAYVPVITTDSYGRVTGVTNTAIAIDTAAITSGTLADARLPTKGTAGTYANATYVPVITTDAYGRVTAVTNTAIQSGTTSVSGIVQLTDSISSTSTTTAATPNSVKTAYDYAQSAFTKANQTAQLAFTTVSANGTSLAADANNDTLTITAASANGIFINADAGTDALDIGLRNSGVTSGTYGNTTTSVTITVDAFGRITSVSNAAISGGATLGDVLALSIALG
jgi:hypothetical protein